MSSRTTSALTAALLAAALVAMSSPSRGQPSTSPRLRVGPNYRLGKDARPARAKEAPALAVNPSNPRHIVEVDLDVRNEQCDFHTSFDGGRTWRGGHLRVPARFDQPPCYPLDISNRPPMYGTVVWGSRQNVYVTFNSERAADRGTSTFVARSTNGGRSFQTAVEAIAGPAEAGSGFNRPGLTVVRGSGPDNVYVFALRQRDDPQSTFPITTGLVVAASTDGGRTFGPPVDVSAPGETGLGQSGLPAAGPDGSLYVPWRRGEFRAPTAALRLGTSRDGGRTWTQQTVANLAGVKEPISLAVDQRNGTLYIAYMANPSGDFDIYVIRSTDRGATWSSPVRVNDDPERNRIAQQAPSVSIGPGGRVDVFWYDQRHRYPNFNPAITGFPASIPTEDVYYAFSTDGGRTFSPNRRLTDRFINRDIGVRRELGAHYAPRSVPLGQNALLVAWTDSREGSVDTDNQDVYLARVTLNPAGSAPSQRLTGRDNAALSVALSRRAYPGGSAERDYERVTKLVVVNASDVGAALAGGVLARANAGPVLLSSRRGLSKQVKQEVARLQPAGAYVIGNTSSLSRQVETDLVRNGVPRRNLVRIAGANAADTARLVAEAAAPAPTTPPTAPFGAALIVNPAGATATAASALAAATPYPVLFVAASSIPEATQQALTRFDIRRTFVVGTEQEVGGEVFSRLPNPTRLSTTSELIRQGGQQGLPQNVVYVGDSRRRIVGALLGPAVARLGGVLLPVAGASDAAARAALGRLGIADGVDRFVYASVGATRSAQRRPARRR